jgi:group I intron endonuclease
MQLIDYKFNKIPGIYKIINNINGKFYVGSTKNLYKRSREHFSKLNRQKHPNEKLMNSVKKHGINNFKFEIIVSYCNIEDLLVLEGKYIALLKPDYNLDEVDMGGKRHCSEETKIKIGEKSKQKFIDNPELKTLFINSIGNISGWNKGLTDIYSEETLKKMSEAGKKNINNRKPEDQETFFKAREKAWVTNKKKILQYDLNMQLIKEWDSITDAAAYFGAKSLGNFSTACKSGIKLFNSYWKKKE